MLFAQNPAKGGTSGHNPSIPEVVTQSFRADCTLWFLLLHCGALRKKVQFQAGGKEKGRKRNTRFFFLPEQDYFSILA
jgi:hypothetical protein